MCRQCRGRREHRADRNGHQHLGRQLQIHAPYPADQTGSRRQIEAQLRRPGGDGRIGGKCHGIGLSAVAVNAAGYVHGDGARPRVPACLPDGGEHFLGRPAQGRGGTDAQDRINDHAGLPQPRGEPVAAGIGRAGLDDSASGLCGCDEGIIATVTHQIDARRPRIRRQGARDDQTVAAIIPGADEVEQSLIGEGAPPGRRSGACRPGGAGAEPASQDPRYAQAGGLHQRCRRDAPCKGCLLQGTHLGDADQALAGRWQGVS